MSQIQPAVNSVATVTRERKVSAVITPPTAEYFSDPKRRELVRSMLMPGGSDQELELFLMQSIRTGLDPFSRQIVAIGVWNKAAKREVYQAVPTIDGHRVVALRTGLYSGQVGPFWCGADGKWTDVWLKREAPAAAKVGVLRKDFAQPLFAIAKFESYARRDGQGNLTGWWKKGPEHMLAKCAEALALRKAFPNDLSGLYVPEELGHASESLSRDVTPPQEETQPPPPQKNPLQENREQQLKVALDLGEYVMPGGKFDKQKIKDIKPAELHAYIVEIKNHAEPLKPAAKKMVDTAEKFLSSIGYEEQEQSDLGWADFDAPTQ